MSKLHPLHILLSLIINKNFDTIKDNTVTHNTFKCIIDEPNDTYTFYKGKVLIAKLYYLSYTQNKLYLNPDKTGMLELNVFCKAVNDIFHCPEKNLVTNTTFEIF